MANSSYPPVLPTVSVLGGSSSPSLSPDSNHSRDKVR